MATNLNQTSSTNPNSKAECVPWWLHERLSVCTHTHTNKGIYSIQTKINEINLCEYKKQTKKFSLLSLFLFSVYLLGVFSAVSKQKSCVLLLFLLWFCFFTNAFFIFHFPFSYYELLLLLRVHLSATHTFNRMWLCVCARSMLWMSVCVCVQVKGHDSHIIFVHNSAFL